MSGGRAEVAATKSNLLRLREQLGFVVAGHELLDQKREVLLEELVEIGGEASELRRSVERELLELYAVLRESLLAAGRAALEAEALADPGLEALRMRERSVMGVIVPLIELETSDLPQPIAAPGDGPSGAARAGRMVRRMLPSLARLAEIETSCRRLGIELKKTQRKVNALENVFIPEYRDSIHAIEGSLEEREREAHFSLKRLKAKAGGRQ
jgi:V/A-type H+-transporting ATPase subunit D